MDFRLYLLTRVSTLCSACDSGNVLNVAWGCMFRGIDAVLYVNRGNYRHYHFWGK